MGHSARPHFTVVGAQKFTASCDASVYLTCVTVSKKSPAEIEICVNEAGSGCTSGSFPSLTWYEAVYTAKGKVTKKIVGSFYPNPGNPSDDTITVKKKVKNSHGNISYYQFIEACFYTSDCISGYVGIYTK